MVLETTASGSELRSGEAAENSRVYQQGLVAGALGAAAIAVWFLAVDVIAGRPLFTPAILGTAIFKGASAVAEPGAVPITFDMVVAFTWIHLLVFLLIGLGASLLLDWAEREPNAGFGIVLFLVVFLLGFAVVSMVLAEPVLRALTLPLVLLGNLFAAGAMAIYLRRRHPRLVIEP
jgi:hypothetical protein